MCIYWRELADDLGLLQEYCRASMRTVGCSGTKKQCEHPEEYMEKKKEVKDDGRGK